MSIWVEVTVSSVQWNMSIELGGALFSSKTHPSHSRSVRYLRRFELSGNWKTVEPAHSSLLYSPSSSGPALSTFSVRYNRKIPTKWTPLLRIRGLAVLVFIIHIQPTAEKNSIWLSSIRDWPVGKTPTFESEYAYSVKFHLSTLLAQHFYNNYLADFEMLTSPIFFLGTFSKSELVVQLLPRLARVFLGS